MMKYGISFDLKQYCKDNGFITLTKYMCDKESAELEISRVIRIAGLEGDNVKGYKVASMTLLVECADAKIVTSARQLLFEIQEPGKYHIEAFETGHKYKAYIAKKI